MKRILLFAITIIAFVSFTMYGQLEIANPDTDQDNYSAMENGFSGGKVDGIELYGGQWCPMGSLPALSYTSIYSAAEWVGDTLYAHLPNTTTASDIMHTYTVGGSWGTTTSMPSAIVGCALVGCNGKLYAVGGDAASVTGASTNFWEYDPATGAWTAMTPLPTGVAGHNAYCWGDSVIFVIGGPWSGSSTNFDYHYYSFATSTWTTVTNGLSPMTAGRRSYAGGISGDKIVVAAGYNVAFLKDLWIGAITDADNITWTQGTDVPVDYSGLSRPGGDALFDHFYVVNGERGGLAGRCDSAFVFDMSTETWVGVVPTKPTPVSNIFHAVAVNSVNDSLKVYVVGGYDVASQYTDVFEYIGCGDLPVIPVELTLFTATKLGNDIDLRWQTATEQNNMGFDIERSADNISFTKIGFVNGYGTTTEPMSYSFVDENVYGTLYYRLRQVDFDGTATFSQVIEVDAGPITSYELAQNYPNPFNPATNISYMIPEAGIVKLAVYDVLGNEIAVLVNEHQKPGQYEVTFDAAGFTSGVYFYTLQSNGFSATKKLMLLR